MKVSLKVFLVWIILLVVAGFIDPWVVLGFIFWSIFFFPVFLIETLALVWLFKNFDTARAINTALVLYMVSATASIFMLSLSDIAIGMIAIGVINLLLHLFLLKFLFKASFSIKGVSAFVFAHIILVICLYINAYWMAQQPLRMTTG